jgi:hypothetical protein
VRQKTPKIIMSGEEIFAISEPGRFQGLWFASVDMGVLIGPRDAKCAVFEATENPPRFSLSTALSKTKP